MSFAPVHAQRGLVDPAAQVRAAETAFAKSMADRNPRGLRSAHRGRSGLLGRQRRRLRGKAAVVADWKRFFDGAAAPFSWAPAEVEVLPSGTLGFTSGPVFDPKGNRIGTFNSVWQRQPDGAWKIVFDKGCPPCDCGVK